MRRRKIKREPKPAMKQLLITKHKPKSPVSEQYRTLRTNIQFSVLDGELNTLMLTSTAPGEGKMTTAANLAVVFAQQGKRVLLVDADLRMPALHYIFNINNNSGLTNVLMKQISIKEAIVPGGENNFFILPSGPIPPNPAEMLGSRAFDKLFAEMKEEFDLVIYDTPPILTVTDAQIIANKCDGTILIVAAGKTERTESLKAKALLEKAGGKLLGVVLNQKKRRYSRYLYYIEKEYK